MFSKVCFKYLYLWEFNTFRDGKKQVAVRNDKVLCLSVPGQKSFEQKLLFINTEFKIYYVEKIVFLLWCMILMSKTKDECIYVFLFQNLTSQRV